MCGICGIYSYRTDSAPVDRRELLATRDDMRTRGPDGEGAWISERGDVGLGHRRLSVIDLSAAGAQPMTTVDGRLRIVFNGEIYNYQALRVELEGRGHRFRSASDTEVLLHLYRERGPEMIERLRGMYAFAIWDEEKRGLLLARDPFGIKPLYFADDGKVFRFASQVKALLKGGGISTTPDPAGHVGFYLWGSVPEPFTLHKEIRSLKPGSALWLDERGAKEETAPKPLTDYFRQESPDTPDKAGGLRTALLDTVAHHLVADVPVGIFLSSGLDSCTLAALATEVCSRQVETVTLGFREFRGSENDEVPLAESTAAYYGTKHHTVWISQRDFEENTGSILAAMDQPSVDGVNVYFVSLAARRAGLKVALSGLGGDEVFGGYSTFRRIPNVVSTLSLLRVLGTHLQSRLPFGGKHGRHKAFGLLRYGTQYETAYLLFRSLFPPWELERLLDPEFLREGWRDLNVVSGLAKTIETVPPGRKSVAALEMNWYMRNQLLRDADWASMAHSIELRVPFLDLSLMGALSSLTRSGSVTKKALSLTPMRPLPAAVANRKKTGFSVPYKQWLEGLHSPTGETRGTKAWSQYVYSRFTSAA